MQSFKMQGKPVHVFHNFKSMNGVFLAITILCVASTCRNKQKPECVYLTAISQFIHHGSTLIRPDEGWSAPVAALPTYSAGIDSASIVIVFLYESQLELHYLETVNALSISAQRVQNSFIVDNL